MLRIFICEDDDIQRKRITKKIEDIVIIENFDMEVAVSTTNPNDIINYLSENIGVGLYFLDIDLNTDINGIQLAAKIRKYDHRGFIVFVTTSSECASLTFKYKVEAMDYIIKDNFNEIHERLKQCITETNTRYYSETTNIQKSFTIILEDRVVTIELYKILFFETSHIKHKVVVHAVDRRIEFYANIKKIMEELIKANLDDNFYRFHQSFLVNKDNIREIDFKKRIIYMINGEVCEISAREARKLKKSNFIRELSLKKEGLII